MKLSEKFAVSAVSAVLFKFIVAGITISLGSKSFTVGGIDGATVAAILTPVLGATHLETWVNKRGQDNDKT